MNTLNHTHFGDTHLKTAAGRRWFVASCVPCKEQLADEHLQRQGFGTFLPLRRQTIRRARRLITRTAPFFPGYLFVRFDPAQQRWRSINGTFGVKRLIMQGERPLPVPHGLVERLEELADGDGLVDLSAGLAPGARVRLLSGPFSDVLGTLDRLDSIGRVRVLISIMNGEIPVTVRLSDLAPAA